MPQIFGENQIPSNLAAMKQYYHFSSDGLKRDILYASEEEFIAGVNRIAVCYQLSERAARQVVVIAYCLMDNHFHFILYGSHEDCKYFVENYKRLTAIWIRKHRGRQLADTIETGVGWLIRPDNLGNKIVYLLRNPVAAKMRFVPHGYRWSSANLMFSDNATLLAGAKKVSEFSLREFRRMINSHIPMPPEWLVLADNQIWPGNYIDYHFAEKQYQSIARFMFALNDRKVDQEAEEEYVSYSVPDSDVRFRAIELCMEYFRKERISLCSGPERLTVAKVLRKEMRCGAKQLGRVLRLSPDDLQLLV